MPITDHIPSKGRILAIDYGGKRLGLAISDALQISANALDTLVADAKKASAIERIISICKQREVAGLVIGKPTNMDGSEGVMVEKVRTFAGQVKKSTGLPVVLWDERLTSIQAERTLREFGKKPGKNKALVDKLAATILLRTFLDNRDR